jgi:ubiquinone/menaquinone biosynthesis C-methylase UbiE
MKSFADHFSQRAAEYSAFRPTYPPELIAFLSSLVPDHDVAWDCGAGSGQASLLLAKHFRQVVATDASQDQVSNAQHDPRVTYRVALAHESGIRSASVDLATVAQALHWFDRAPFYEEVRRVLKPSGVLAVWCHSRIQAPDDVSDVVNWFYSVRVAKYWPKERRHVEAGYRDLEFPFEETESQPWSMTAALNLEEFIGYVGTWSAVAQALKAEGADPTGELEKALIPKWGARHERKSFTWPIGLRIGRCRDERR